MPCNSIQFVLEHEAEIRDAIQRGWEAVGVGSTEAVWQRVKRLEAAGRLKTKRTRYRNRLEVTLLEVTLP